MLGSISLHNTASFEMFHSATACVYLQHLRLDAGYLHPVHLCFSLPHGTTDMPIFGQCPAQDDFYLVMCSHCSQVVKPQAFQAHYGKSHTHKPS